VVSDTRVPRAKRGASKQRHDEPHVYQRGAWWWGHFGGRRRESLGTQDQVEAARRFAERLEELRRAIPARPASGLALTELVREYTAAPHGWTPRTLHTAKLCLASFVEAMATLGVERAEDVTPAVLDGWRERRMQEAGRATILRNESAVRGAFRWAVSRELLTVDPFDGRAPIRTPRRRARRTVPTPAQVLAVAEWLEDRGEVGGALVLRVGLSTGLRLDELRHLRLDDIGERSITVRPEDGAAAEAWTTKGYAERVIPVQPAVCELARSFVLWRESPRTVKRGARKGQQYVSASRAKAITAGWIGDVIDRARAALAAQTPAVEIAPFRAHDLRRLFVTMSHRAGVPLDVVQRWVGHADLTTTQGYLVTLVSDADLVAPALGL
jgi:integrase